YSCASCSTAGASARHGGHHAAQKSTSTGWGDCGLSGKERATVECVHEFQSWLVGQDPFRSERMWQELFRGSFWRGGPVIMTALSAIDTALWDLKGKALDAPVYELLGGLARDKVRVYR